MSLSTRIIHTPFNATADVVTGTGIAYKFGVPGTGVLQIGLSYIDIATTIATDTIAAVIALQLVRDATTYTLATVSPDDGDTAGEKSLYFTPSTSVTLPDGTTRDLTDQPFIALETDDIIQTNVTTAGTDSQSAAGAYRAHYVIDLSSYTS